MHNMYVNYVLTMKGKGRRKVIDSKKISSSRHGIFVKI